MGQGTHVPGQSRQGGQGHMGENVTRVLRPHTAQIRGNKYTLQWEEFTDLVKCLLLQAHRWEWQ